VAFQSKRVQFFGRAWTGGRVFFGMLAVLVGAAAIATLGFGTAVLPVLAGLGSLAAYPLAFAFMVFARRARKPMEGKLVADEGGVSWDGRRLVSRADLRGGFVVPAFGGAPEVRLTRRFPWGPLDFLVPDEDTGRQILAALGLDAAQTIATIRLASLLRGTAAGTAGNVAAIIGVFAAMILVGNGSPVTAAILAIAIAAWVVVSSIPAHARIGADGVFVEGLGKRSFHRFDDLSGVRMFVGSGNAGVILAGRDGAETKLPMMGLFTASIARDDIMLAVKRIEQASEVHRLAQADRGVALPTRGDRPILDWVRSLRALGSGANADHRTAPVRPDALFRIAEDPGTEPARRVAAAVALGASVDAPGRERLRIAAATTADPALREVLELAADEAANEEALAVAVERADALGGLAHGERRS
jgi:hypothetical protein